VRTFVPFEVPLRAAQHLGKQLQRVRTSRGLAQEQLGNMFIARYQNKPEGFQRRLLPVRDKESSGGKSRKSGLGWDIPGKFPAMS